MPELKLVKPVTLYLKATCGYIQVGWELLPLELFCSGKLDYMVKINSSELGWSKTIPSRNLAWFNYGTLPTNKTYSVQVHPMYYHSKKYVGLPSQQEVTVPKSGKTP